MNDKTLEEEEKRKHHRSLSQKWTAFIKNTTLHGIRNVLPSQRPKVSRVVWTVVMLTFGAYFIYTFYKAVNKYLQYHTVTLITKNYEQNMSFPAVSICPDNLFSRGKIMMQDDDPFFAAQGLNMSACEVTRELRQREMNNMSCGLAMICCCAFFGYKTNPIYYPNCTKQRRSALQKAIEESGVLFNMEEFFTVFSPDSEEMLSHYFACLFQWSEDCSASDFETEVTQYGICRTFNSGKNNRSKVSYRGGVSSGLAILLNVSQSDYTLGHKIAQGFSISIHAQGESFNGFDAAFSVMPGTYATISLTEQRFKHLDRYGKKCKTMKLKSFSRYTTDGCLEECYAKRYMEYCGCRPAGITGSSIEVCQQKHADCLHGLGDTVKCDCPVSCNQTKYKAEISFSKLLDHDKTISIPVSNWFSNVNGNSQDFVYLIVGFKSLSYELQEEKLVYDIYAMFGEIGGNMGLLLGCSVLTLCEFIEFLCSVVAAKLCKRTNITPVTSVQ
ncbi:acid-sensing ion channel 1A-like [Porites lutea]|uniref:acid-sensing ion channel 1A-like n=1 Tax=Porites lutea TaxID=51062 RepID=UPI003CC5A16A